jgi:hypothetical protein
VGVYEDQQRQNRELHEQRVAAWHQREADQKAKKAAEWAALLRSNQQETARQTAEWEALRRPRAVEIEGPGHAPIEPIDLDNL